ncbi:hypothetical protein PHYBOEH_008857 [Phytophthora boehmeriae]|uniref:Uncharacterized protein n=1 Tax=Phytophthora boehmeriae TaxID=109152 RepID=A0A8T1W1S1_9STRA|nr:hypothetical protein PHYBOEH_008857 [Phytophthora boehmeriae]
MTLSTAAILLLAFFTNSVSAWYGTVAIYQDAYFEGPKFPWGITNTQRCHYLSCWNDKASSVKWEGLPTTGTFNGKARIVFFAGKNCTGTSRDWPTDGVINGKNDNYPQDFKLDGINDDVASFMIWENSKSTKNAIATPYPWGTN